MENRRDARAPFSGVFENQNAAVFQMDFRCFPFGRLVKPVWVRLIGIPGTVAPAEAGFVVGDPFLDGLPGRLDRLHGFDVERRRWWAGELDDAFPQAVETEEQFDLLGPFDGTCEFHGSFAARALEYGSVWKTMNISRPRLPCDGQEKRPWEPVCRSRHAPSG